MRHNLTLVSLAGYTARQPGGSRYVSISSFAIFIASARMQYKPINIMGRPNRKIIYHEVQYLRKGETYETAFNNCNKKEAHRNYINISDIQRMKDIDKCGADHTRLPNINDVQPVNNTE